DNILETMKAGRFNAAFLAVGAHIGKRAYIPAGSAAKVLDAVTLLRSMEGEDQPLLGRRVVVYGGGNTAIDAARTAKRLGATEAIIVYSRTRDRMPAPDFEAGEFETLEAESLVLALGQDVDLSLLDGVPGLVINDGVVQIDANMMTGHTGIFAGGDMVPSERTVTVAVGHGKKAARHIDAWLRGAAHALAEKHELTSFDKLNSWYYADAPKTVRPMLEGARRQNTFEEIQGGLDETNALYEARRCLSCGNCFECDNCYGVCPDNAVIKLGPGNRFRFNYDYCKGCALCATECPCGAIKMVPESI